MQRGPKKSGANCNMSHMNMDDGKMGMSNLNKEKEDKSRRNFITELRKFFDNADILKISPADVPFVAKRVETAITSRDALCWLTLRILLINL